MTNYKDAIYQRYQTVSSSALNRGDAGRVPYLRRLIRSHMPARRSSAILELGCGDGLLLSLLTDAGYADVQGVDASSEQVASAKARGLTRVRLADLRTTVKELPPESVDAIVAFDVLEHLTRQAAFELLQGASVALRPGGKILLHVPNGTSPFHGVVLFGDVTHEAAYTTESLTQLLLAAGFKDLEFYEDSPPVHGLKSAVRRVLWSALRTGLRAAYVVETGILDNPVLSYNLLAVGSR